MYKQISLLLSFTAATLLLSACAAKTPSNIVKIEQDKQKNLKKNIRITNSSNAYKAYINDDYELEYLCYRGDTNKCNYKKDSLSFWVNNKGYYPPISPSTSGVQCGTGSLFGWLAIFPMKPFAIQNYTKKNSAICNSPFTTLDSTQIGERFFFGLITFMTPFVTGGTLHTVKFDKDEFTEAVYVSNIESFREKLFELTSSLNIEGGFDIIYLEKGDIDDNLEEKYEQLLSDRSKKAGMIFLEKESNRLLAVNVFSRYNDKDLITSISLQIQDLLKGIAKNDQYTLTYDDITPYIPEEVKLPKIPPVPTLQKDEFETKSEFEQRVKDAVASREKLIRELQRKYSLDVYERNTYIDNLQKSYELYLQQTAQNKNNLLKELEDSLAMLSKVLFLENTSGYEAKNFKYDAETQKLYFTIYSQNRGFEQEVVASVPSSTAKQIKHQKSFKIIPNIDASANKLSLLGFEILETSSNESFPTAYTNINYKPQEIKVAVLSNKENIDKKLSNYFKRYKQKDNPIVDTSKKEIWYIDIAKNINAKVPKWFSNPASKNKIIGYGEGRTLQEAKANARADLSFMVKVKVNTVFENTSNINNFKSFNEVKEQTKQSSDIELSYNDYKVYKQDNVDSKWYVGLEYIK